MLGRMQYYNYMKLFGPKLNNFISMRSIIFEAMQIVRAIEYNRSCRQNVFEAYNTRQYGQRPTRLHYPHVQSTEIDAKVGVLHWFEPMVALDPLQSLLD